MELTFIVSTPDGTSHRFDVAHFITIGQLKSYISQQLGVRVDYQRLFLLETELDDETLVRDVSFSYSCITDEQNQSEARPQQANQLQPGANGQDRNRHAEDSGIGSSLNLRLLQANMHMNLVLDRFFRQHADDTDSDD